MLAIIKQKNDNFDSSLTIFYPFYTYMCTLEHHKSDIDIKY